MKASYRATLILELTRILAKLGFTRRDVVLDQFEVAEDSLSGSIVETTARRLARASDAALIGLADHFGLSVPDEFRAHLKPHLLDVDRIWSTASFGRWRINFVQPYFRLFISHTSNNAALATLLKQKLCHFGISAFVAHEDIEPTREWQIEIESALQTMDGVLALLTADFHASPWTDQEIGSAVGRRLPIIPLSVDGTIPYGLIGKIQALKLAKMSEVNWGKDIFTRLSQQTQSQSLMRDVLVRQFETTGSYDNAFLFVTMLDEIGKLSEEQLQRLFYAAIRNDQILPARFVSGKLESLFQKHSYHPNVTEALAIYEFQENKKPRRGVMDWLAQYEIAEQL